ncbi:MAG: hypothetical protein AB9903_22455 [Vulcanimicrobiota bacterium]
MKCCPAAVAFLIDKTWSAFDELIELHCIALCRCREDIPRCCLSIRCGYQDEDKKIR